MPYAVDLCDEVLARPATPKKFTAPRHAPRSVLHWLLLGPDDADVCCGVRECRVDVRFRDGDGSREERILGAKAQRSVGRNPAHLGRRHIFDSRLTRKSRHLPCNIKFVDI